MSKLSGNDIILLKDRTFFRPENRAEHTEEIMTIDQNKNGSELQLQLSGRLDTATAPQLDAVIKENLESIQSLVIDLKKVEYLSSAGLRVLLAAQKAMNGKKGTMSVLHPNDMVQEVFEMTGFTSILTIVK